MLAAAEERLEFSRMIDSVKFEMTMINLMMFDFVMLAII